MSDFTIQKATRRGVIPIIGFYAESGCGKTMSALLLARGLVGPVGDIHLIDTESRRGSIYADVIPGGYSVLDLDAPFTPARYTQALDAIYKAGAKVAVIDSASHEWEGMGGVLDMATDNEERTQRPGLHNWKQPKFEHAKFVQFMLRSPIPIVVCIRAKRKTHQTKKFNQQKNKMETVIEKDEFASPIQAEDFIFELTAHAEILPDHSINLTKCSHPELRKCFPEKGPITVQHGELISKWCLAGGQPVAPTVTAKTGKTSDPLAALKGKLWTLTESKHGGNPENLESYLKSANLIDPDARVSALTEATLKYIIGTIETDGLP